MTAKERKKKQGAKERVPEAMIVGNRLSLRIRVRVL